MIYTSFDKYNRYIQAGGIDSLQFYKQGEAGPIHRIQHYFASRSANTTDAIHQYPDWLKRYIGSVVYKRINSIKVDKVVFTYNDQGYATIISKTNLLDQ
jgi:hypothetical protein